MAQNLGTQSIALVQQVLNSAHTKGCSMFLLHCTAIVWNGKIYRADSNVETLCIYRYGWERERWERHTHTHTCSRTYCHWALAQKYTYFYIPSGQFFKIHIQKLFITRNKTVQPQLQVVWIFLWKQLNRNWQISICSKEFLKQSVRLPRFLS